MKIAHFERCVTPPVGTPVAGYGTNDVSVMKFSDLMLNGICLDDGSRKVLIISYDLLGFAREVVLDIRRRCAKLINGRESDVMLSCTHTHGAPHTRHIRCGIEVLDKEYCQFVAETTEAAVAALKEEDFVEVDCYFYSAQVNANINRRYCGPENVCQMVFEHRLLQSINSDYKDQEAGMLIFYNKKNRPQEILINYAAHPLAAHCKGDSAFAISADYPAVVRKLVSESAGCPVTFVTGAAGDQFPIDFEGGFMALDTIARPLAQATLKALVEVARNQALFKMPDAKLDSICQSFSAEIDPAKPLLHGRTEADKTYELELQCLSVGDICFVGVPCELLAELGAEIKWHTPFRRAFIAYNSTDYIDYICHGNALVAGGYEARSQRFIPTVGLKLVNNAVEAMYKLKAQE